MVAPPLSAPYCAVGDGSAEDLCLAPQQPHLLGRVPSHVHLRHFCHGWYVSGYQYPSSVPPTPNTVCMLSAPPLPHPHQALCACSCCQTNRLLTPDYYICSLAYAPAPPPGPTPLHSHTAFVTLLSLSIHKEPPVALILVGLFSLVQWVSILAFPLVQAARLNTSCHSLRNLGHLVRSRPLSYTRMSYLHLDSFLSYTATQQLPVSTRWSSMNAGWVSESAHWVSGNAHWVSGNAHWVSGSVHWVSECRLGVCECRLGVGECRLGVGECRLGVGECKLGVGECRLGVDECTLGPYPSHNPKHDL